MKRVISYVDGFNLYFGLKEKGWKKYYWLDLVALSQALLKEDQHLEHCHYFTARIRNHSNMAQNASRQTLWLDALACQQNLKIHYGHYLEKQRECKSCGAKWIAHEEKMTDVNIATQILSDAFDDKFDVALVISGDSDLTTPIKTVLERFPRKRIIVAFPPKRHSDQLRKTATASFTIGESKLRNNRLPKTIKTQTGFTLTCPESWS